MSTYLRKIRTTQELRNSQDGLCRSKRKSRLLPNSWCDIIRGDIYDRSWKRFRKDQYKVK